MAKPLQPEELLSAIIRDGSIACLVVTLCEALDADPAEIRRAARDLVKRGLIAWWNEAPDGPSVCLTPLAVEGLDLEPDGSGKRFIPRGSRRRPDKIQDRRAIQESQIGGDDGVSVFDGMPDSKATDPSIVADYEDEPPRSDTRPPRGQPQRLMLMVGLTPSWPVPYVPGERCRCCAAVKHAFLCLVCSSSSNDHMFGKPPSQKTLDKQAGRFVKADGKGKVLRGGTEGQKVRERLQPSR